MYCISILNFLSEFYNTNNFLITDININIVGCVCVWVGVHTVMYASTHYMHAFVGMSTRVRVHAHLYLHTHTYTKLSVAHPPCLGLFPFLGVSGGHCFHL